ncbi:hypothetical protein BD779DRAFT_1570910 [Infundibulicybe gibba]|nr:hypothetical protein BD779DRAFT_1570910 [Infundibulicybe gibba]
MQSFFYDGILVLPQFSFAWLMDCFFFKTCGIGCEHVFHGIKMHWVGRGVPPLRHIECMLQKVGVVALCVQSVERGCCSCSWAPHGSGTSLVHCAHDGGAPHRTRWASLRPLPQCVAVFHQCHTHLLMKYTYCSIAHVHGDTVSAQPFRDASPLHRHICCKLLPSLARYPH